MPACKVCERVLTPGNPFSNNLGRWGRAISAKTFEWAGRQGGRGRGSSSRPAHEGRVRRRHAHGGKTTALGKVGEVKGGKRDQE